MKIPSIRFYLDDDYDEVVRLFEDHGYDPPERSGLLGTSMVAHDEKTGDLLAFVWALAAEGVRVAYVDHLVVDKRFRGSSVGVVLMATLASFLRHSGVEEILAVTRPENVALIRMLTRRGAEDRGEFRALSIKIGVSEEVGVNGEH